MDIKERLTGEYLAIYNELIMPVDTNIKFESVILSDENTQKINDFITEYSYRDKFIKYGLEPMNRILMYGASGTGKTFLAKALANHLGFTMLYVDIAKSLSEGNVSMNVSNVFKLGNYLGNCIIFFDEADSIAWRRDSGDSEGGNVRRATNSIFQQLDQMNTDNIFVSATNMLFRLDPAFERRFNMKMEFRRPELDLTEAVRKFLFKEFKLEDDVDPTIRDIVERRAKSSDVKLSYYEIQSIVERAMKQAIMNDTTIVKTSNIYSAFAVSMRIKIKFKTNNDPEIIFKSSIE